MGLVISGLSQTLSLNMYWFGKSPDPQSKIFYSNESGIFYSDKSEMFYSNESEIFYHDKTEIYGRYVNFFLSMKRVKSYKRNQCNLHEAGSIYFYYE
jgi:hypothetical protein